MRTIHFRNGETAEVPQEIVDVMIKRIAAGCGEFQSFSDQHGKFIITLNLREIIYSD